jgi:demethylmenaquinone methyltransferase/2-methoxy-6-polyprenyl-1,4-benzoquinol methylase
MAMVPDFLDTITAKLRRGGKAIFLDMLFKDAFRKEPNHRDPDGNRVFRRTLPNGSEFEVVKNFPTEIDFHRVVSQRTVGIEYFLFEDLERWRVSMELREGGQVGGGAGRQ